MRLRSAAVDHADSGARVHPLRPGGKTPKLRGWQSAATSSTSQIETWWDKWPEANIGIVIDRGVVLVDIDTARAHDEFRERVPVKNTRVVRTPRGGWHYLFRGSLHSQVLIRTEDGGRPLEIKGPGTNRVAPGSICSEGTWELAVDVGEDEPVPPELVSWVDSTRVEKTSARTRAGADQRGGPIARGQRNMTLTSMAGRLRRIGGTQDGIEAFLLIHNQQFCEPLLEEEEVERIAASVARYPLGPPWTDAWSYASQVGDAYGLSYPDRALLTVLYGGAKDSGLVIRGMRRLQRETGLSSQTVCNSKARVVDMQLVDVVSESPRFGTTYLVKAVLDLVSVAQGWEGTAKGDPSVPDLEHSAPELVSDPEEE